MRIIGRTFECSKAPENEAPPFVDEAVFEAAEKLTEAQRDLEKMTVDALKKYAEEKQIDLVGARTKAEIVSAIYAAKADKEVQ